MSEVTKNEVAKFLEELLLVGDPWEVQSVSHQMGGVDRSAGRVTIELAVGKGSWCPARSVGRCANAMTRRCGNGATWASAMPCQSPSTPKCNGSNGRLAATEAARDSGKPSTSTWVWTSIRGGHPHLMLKPLLYKGCLNLVSATRPEIETTFHVAV